jgi:hypothetical protein
VIEVTFFRFVEGPNALWAHSCPSVAYCQSRLGCHPSVAIRTAGCYIITRNEITSGTEVIASEAAQTSFFNAVQSVIPQSRKLKVMRWEDDDAITHDPVRTTSQISSVMSV